MHVETIAVAIVAGMIFSRLAAELWLSSLNCRHVRAHAGEPPRALRNFIDQTAYQKSIAYTLARQRFGNVEAVFSAMVLPAVLFSGILPRTFRFFSLELGPSPWAMATCIFAVGIAVSLLSLPFDWISQFRLEQKFGFNTTTQRTWWLDRLKVLLLALVLGYPLLVLLLKIVTWAGPWWWLWDWSAEVAFQLLASVLAPVLILPLFNKLTPLPEGPLRQTLLELTRRARFQAKGIQLMDGSKRSRHSNAFFTGFGRFRKIVLFDTLVAQLSESELEAVVAHEIGHYQRRHIPKMLVFASVSLLACFYLAAVLARQDWFYRAFGFAPGNIAPALLVLALLAGTIGFWTSPLINWWSRRFEYQADAFAAQVVGQTRSLVGALRKLSEGNLSNLVPHPIYSRFYYSHPTLLERETALEETLKANSN